LLVGGAEVWIVRMTWSVFVSTTDTLRETKFVTYARRPSFVIAIPCGFLPALAPAVAGLAGSLRSM
jgi:hypothetical protein